MSYTAIELDCNACFSNWRDLDAATIDAAFANASKCGWTRDDDGDPLCPFHSRPETPPAPPAPLTESAVKEIAITTLELFADELANLNELAKLRDDAPWNINAINLRAAKTALRKP